MATTIEKLEAEQRELDSRRKRLDKRADKLREEYRQLDRDKERIWSRIRAERLKVHIGKPVRTSGLVSGSDGWMNDAIGTLVKVKRTVCVVDYGDVGRKHGGGDSSEWELPIYDVIATNELKGRSQTA